MQDCPGRYPTEALLDRPYGIELDGEANLYIADTYNQCIRRVVLVEGSAGADA
jgi:hypothetical protein